MKSYIGPYDYLKTVRKGTCKPCWWERGAPAWCLEAGNGPESLARFVFAAYLLAPLLCLVSDSEVLLGLVAEPQQGRGSVGQCCDHWSVGITRPHFSELKVQDFVAYLAGGSLSYACGAPFLCRQVQAGSVSLWMMSNRPATDIMTKYWRRHAYSTPDSPKVFHRVCTFMHYITL